MFHTRCDRVDESTLNASGSGRQLSVRRIQMWECECDFPILLSSTELDEKTNFKRLAPEHIYQGFPQKLEGFKIDSSICKIMEITALPY